MNLFRRHNVIHRTLSRRFNFDSFSEGWETIKTILLQIPKILFFLALFTLPLQVEIIPFDLQGRSGAGQLSIGKLSVQPEKNWAIYQQVIRERCWSFTTMTRIVMILAESASMVRVLTLSGELACTNRRSAIHSISGLLGIPLIFWGVVSNRIGNFYAGVILYFLVSDMWRSDSWRDWLVLKLSTRRRSLPYTSSEKRSALTSSWV